MNASVVLGYRRDVYDTPAGPQEKPCVCNEWAPCLYHWYYEIKGGSAPKGYSHGTVGNADQRQAPRGAGKDPARKPGVRRDDRGDSDRPRKSGPKRKR